MDDAIDKAVVEQAKQPAKPSYTERLALGAEARARQAKAKLEIARANADIELIRGDRLASDAVKVWSEELAKQQLKLDEDRVAMDDLERTREESYEMKVFTMDADVEERVAEGITEGTKEVIAEFTTKIKEALEMYHQGVFWAEKYIEIVGLQEAYTNLGGEVRKDMEKRAKALGLVVHNEFNFDTGKAEPKLVELEERAMSKKHSNKKGVK